MTSGTRNEGLGAGSGAGTDTSLASNDPQQQRQLAAEQIALRSNLQKLAQLELDADEHQYVLRLAALPLDVLLNVLLNVLLTVLLDTLLNVILKLLRNAPLDALLDVLFGCTEPTESIGRYYILYYVLVLLQRSILTTILLDEYSKR